MQVTGVEQRQADPRLLRRPDHRHAHRIGVLVGDAAGTVMHIVELAHQRHSGQRHLGKASASEREHRFGIEPAGELVHLASPGPERAARRLSAAAQRALESMRVCVRESWDDEPPQHLSAGRRLPDTAGNRSDPLAVALDHDAVGGRAVVPQPRPLAPQKHYAASRV